MPVSIYSLLQLALTSVQANQTAEMRWDYGDPELGTCQETIEGGSHFRYWTQNGKQHDT